MNGKFSSVVNSGAIHFAQAPRSTLEAYYSTSIEGLNITIAFPALHLIPLYLKHHQRQRHRNHDNMESERGLWPLTFPRDPTRYPGGFLLARQGFFW